MFKNRKSVKCSFIFSPLYTKMLDIGVPNLKIHGSPNNKLIVQADRCVPHSP